MITTHQNCDCQVCASELDKLGVARASCSALASAMDDGQEVKMFKLMGAGKGYCVTIHGDCHCESRGRVTLEEAIAEASSKYEQWLKDSE